MKALIVEDEAKTGDYLRKGLSENGFIVDLASNGQDGLHLALTGEYDIIVLDVMLPGKDGWSVLQELRRSQQTPVIFLTARDKVEDIRTHLKEGDEIETKIINVDRKNRSINLSVKAKDMADEADVMQKLNQEQDSGAAGTTNLGALLKAKLDVKSAEQ